MAVAILHALSILIGQEGEAFIFALIDPVEWADTRYFHQN